MLSLYAGVTSDPHQISSAGSREAIRGTFLVPVTNHFFAGAEASYCSFGKYFTGYPGTSASTSPSASIVHLNVWQVNATGHADVRIRRRLHAYSAIVAGASFLRYANQVSGARAIGVFRPGIGLGVGAYGFAPGLLGAEARWNLIADRDPSGITKSLPFYTLTLGLNLGI